VVFLFFHLNIDTINIMGAVTRKIFDKILIELWTRILKGTKKCHGVKYIPNEIIMNMIPSLVKNSN